MYNLGVLSDKELEDLAKDILEAELEIQLQNFKKGKDKGIDLRFSSDIENRIVVQVKHYHKSKFANLKSDLVKKEKPKLETLNVERYIVFTSLELNTSETDIIKNELAPYVLSTNDIYGGARVHSLISKYPEIEKKHYKLWLSSTAVLHKMLNNAVEGRSLFFENKILEKISLYVPTQNFKDALRILNDKKVVIVTGQPGVGKTTISYLLICELLSRDFKLVLVTDSIKEAENVLSDNPDDKQIIFFDDFLGSNINEVLNPRNTESTIVNFIERIQASKNKYLIFTTRTTILNQVEFHYEKFKRVKRGQNLEFEVQLKEYSKLDKARILYNHIFHSELDEAHREVFFKDHAYLKVIEHRNYSPRLIEFITTKRFFNGDDGTFESHIFKNLDNPNEVWQKAFDDQLTDYDRFLLITLLSIGGYNVKQVHLELAYENRLEYEIQFGGFRRTSDTFLNSIKKLLDSFVSAHKKSDFSNEFSLLNPSIGDFLIEYLKVRKPERKRILLSIKYFTQINKYFDTDLESKKGKISLDSDEVSEFYFFFQTNCQSIIPLNDEESQVVHILSVYLNFLRDFVIEEDILRWIEEINPVDISPSQFYQLIGVLFNVEKYGSCKRKVQEQFEPLVHRLFQLCDVSDEFSQVLRLFQLYNVDFEKFLAEDNNFWSIAGLMSEAINMEFSDNYTDFIDNSTILSLVRKGSSKDALNHIEDRFSEHTDDFISDSRITNLENDELSEKLLEAIQDDTYVFADNILSNVLENEDYSEEEIYDDDYMAELYAERMGRRSIRRRISDIFNKEPSDEEKIKNLFDR